MLLTKPVELLFRKNIDPAVLVVPRSVKQPASFMRNVSRGTFSFVGINILWS